MAPFTDPRMNQLMTSYYGSRCNPKYLYDGSQEDIVKEMHAWVIRRQEVSWEQEEMREKILESTIEVKIAPTKAQHDKALAEGMRCLKRAEVVDNEENEDTARAKYLLDTLRRRDILWPKLWWRPDYDGGVCSFLGTVDPNFDPDYTLAVLEDPRREERFNVRRAEIEARVSSKVFEDPLHDSESSAEGERDAAEGSAPEIGKMMRKGLISAMNTHPAKWAKIVRAVDSGRYPHIKIEEARLVATVTNRVEAEFMLTRFLTDALKSLEDK